jgi:hypothetical protein
MVCRSIAPTARDFIMASPQRRDSGNECGCLKERLKESLARHCVSFAVVEDIDVMGKFLVTRSKQTKMMLGPSSRSNEEALTISVTLKIGLRW